MWNGSTKSPQEALTASGSCCSTGQDSQVPLMPDGSCFTPSFRLFLSTLPDSPCLAPDWHAYHPTSLLLLLPSPSTWACWQFVMTSSEFYSFHFLTVFLLKLKFSDTFAKILHSAFHKPRIGLRSHLPSSLPHCLLYCSYTLNQSALRQPREITTDRQPAVSSSLNV